VLVAAAVAAAAPARLGGFLPLDDATRDAWCWSAAWVWPVGDPYELGAPDADGAPGFRRLRGLESAGRGHHGADLGNRRAGDVVRAAASGLVLRVVGDRWTNGYGRHVVLAHRLAEGGIVYSVYAHLGPYPDPPREGAAVRAGQPLGRVGRSGRATTDHLHFEVRRAGRPGERWEKAEHVDPLAFVAGRLPPDPGPGWDAPYRLWGAAAALVEPGADPGAPLDRAAWWRMLWGAARLSDDEPPAEPRAWAAALAAAGVLRDASAGGPGGAPTWEDVARDLGRLRDHGVRLPPGPMAPQRQRERCEHELGVDRPGHHPERLGRRREHPTLAQALLALADLAPPAGP
jgi:hypothetical protein